MRASDLGERMGEALGKVFEAKSRALRDGSGEDAAGIPPAATGVEAAAATGSAARTATGTTADAATGAPASAATGSTARTGTGGNTGVAAPDLPAEASDDDLGGPLGASAGSRP
jgi:hypothetical protein